MTHKALLTAAALLASTAFALAQTAPPANDSKAAAPAPPAIQNAPPDKLPGDDAKLKARAEPKPGAAETTGDAATKSDELTAPLKPGETSKPIDQSDPPAVLHQPAK